MTNAEAIAELKALREDAPLYQFAIDHALHLLDSIDTPHTTNFLAAVQLEALHQRERWGTEHDSGKAPSDWFWLLGWLAGKSVHAAVSGDVEKAKHHAISSAAVLLNWHAALGLVDSRMRPGIEEPTG
jgi:hypothetical protein